MVMVWFGCVRDLWEDLQVRAMLADTAPETRPRSATIRSTLSYVERDADHSNRPGYFGPRYFCSSHDVDRNSCRGARSSPAGLRSAHVRDCRGNLERTRRPGFPCYSGQVIALPRGREERGAPSTAVPSLDLGAIEGGVSAGGIDRDATVTLAIPGGHPRDTSRAIRGPFAVQAVRSLRECARNGCGSARGTAVPPWRPLNLLTSASCACARLLPRRSNNRCSPVPVAHARPLRLVSFGRFSPVPVAHYVLLSDPFRGKLRVTSASCARRAPLWSLSGGCRSHQCQLRISASFRLGVLGLVFSGWAHQCQLRTGHSFPGGVSCSSAARARSHTTAVSWSCRGQEVDRRRAWPGRSAARDGQARRAPDAISPVAAVVIGGPAAEWERRFAGAVNRTRSRPIGDVW
jgi:hypothetical protein